MNDIERLNHTKWDCKYHLIWIPKYRENVIRATPKTSWEGFQGTISAKGEQSRGRSALPEVYD